MALRREGLCPLGQRPAIRIQGIPVSGDVQPCRTVHRSIDIIDIDVPEVRGDETWLGFRLSLFFFFREALAAQTTPVPQEELATIRNELGAVKGKLNVIPGVGIGAVGVAARSYLIDSRAPAGDHNLRRISASS